MMETPQASMSLVCQPTILCSGDTKAALEYSPAQPAHFLMDGYPYGSSCQHQQDGGGKWAPDPFGSRPPPAPCG